MKRMAIEDLVRWAYKEELPKVDVGDGSLSLPDLGYGSSWGAVSTFGKLLTVVDVNCFGVVNDRGATRDAHPDALRLGQAVQSLDEVELDFPEDWSPLDDLGDLGPSGRAAIASAIDRLTAVDCEGVRRLRQTPRLLVFKHAILGDRPDWECERPEIKFVRPSHGGPALWFVRRRVQVGEDLVGQPTYEEREVDGYNHKQKRPYRDAYRKTFLDPDPTPAAIARAEWEVWRAALDILAIELEGELVEHEVAPCELPFRPWEQDAGEIAQKGRVLPDLTPQRVYTPVLRRRRQKAVSGV